MTATAPMRAEAEPPTTGPGESSDEEAPPFLARVTPSKLALMAVSALLAAAVIWLVFADPIAHVWYQARQHDLANQAANVGSSVGSLSPKTGDEVGILQDPDPANSLNVVIADGDSPSVLRGGPGHLPGTPLPGQRGNSIVYGHDKDWGGPFSRLGRLKVGDELYVQARTGSYKTESPFFVYTVTSVVTTKDTDLKPLAQSNDYRLTLITGAGGRVGGDQDLVVTAVSGVQGKVTGGAPKTGSLEPGSGPLLFNWSVLSFLIWAAGAAVVIVLIARRHRPSVVVAIGTPLVLAALVPLLLELDVLAFRPLA